MYESSFHLNAEFLDELWRRLREDEDELTRELSPDPPDVPSMIPSPEDLRALVEAVFWASMRKDEGREVSFVLAYEEPEPCDSSFVFRHPVELAAASLARLAPAVNNADARVGTWHGASGVLEVWGYTSLDSGSFELTVLEPGSLVVTFGAANLAAVFGTRAVFIDGACLLPSCAIWSKAFPPGPDGTEGERTRERKIESVLEVARSMRWHGRGGTLLVVPQGDAWRASLQEPLVYEPMFDFPRARESFSRVDEAASLYGAQVDAQRDWRLLLSERLHRPAREHRMSLRSVARLTAVDGAMVMTSDLEVAVFGAKIRAIDADVAPETVLVREPVEGTVEEEVPLARLGNTRHQSAAQFVFDQRDALAVVASQDRAVTILSWDDAYGGVVAIRHAELALL